MLVYNDKQVSINEIKEALEGSDVEAKVEAMQKAVTMLLNGEQLPQLFITIVRYVLPSEDHAVQKLLLLYLVGAGWLLSCCKQQACNPRLASCLPQPVQDLNVLAWAFPAAAVAVAGSHREDGRKWQGLAGDGEWLPAQQPHSSCRPCCVFWGKSPCKPLQQLDYSFSAAPGTGVCLCAACLGGHWAAAGRTGSTHCHTTGSSDHRRQPLQQLHTREYVSWAHSLRACGLSFASSAYTYAPAAVCSSMPDLQLAAADVDLHRQQLGRCWAVQLLVSAVCSTAALGRVQQPARTSASSCTMVCIPSSCVASAWQMLCCAAVSVRDVQPCTHAHVPHTLRSPLSPGLGHQLEAVDLMGCATPVAPARTQAYVPFLSLAPPQTPHPTPPAATPAHVPLTSPPNPPPTPPPAAPCCPHTDPDLPEPAQQPAAPQRVHPGRHAALPVPHTGGGDPGATSAQHPRKPGPQVRVRGWVL
jgi:hypothetical protein